MLGHSDRLITSLIRVELCKLQAICSGSSSNIYALVGG